jgi:hypothetical protein
MTVGPDLVVVRRVSLEDAEQVRLPEHDQVVERLIGSIRRESLNHLIVFDEAQLRRVLTNYASYYN